MTLKVLSVSSSRADLGALAPVWRALSAEPGIALHVALTGMHRGGGGDRDAARASVPAGATAHEVGTSIGGKDAVACVAAMSTIMADVGRLIAETAPDVVLVMGDRLDMIPAALAAVPFNVPVAHLHGGELTLGAVDDRLRHAMSKLSHVHLCSGADAARRLARMGEAPDRIHITGAPGLDALSAVPVLSRAAFLDSIGLPDGLLRLVTVHPETNAADPLAAARAVIGALAAEDAPALLTAANADMDGEAINEQLRALADRRTNVAFRDTLGTALYANALRHAAVMLGNSSSGLVEAGLFGLPVINVGGRQDGRLRGLNVRDVPADASRITAALSTITGFRYDPADVSLYGDAKAGPRVAAQIAAMTDRRDLLAKGFHEGEARFVTPWAKASTVRTAATPAPEDAGTLVVRSTIVDGLRGLGVARGDTLLVHTSLSALGFVAGGARTVVEALLEAVGQSGTVVMPTFTGDLTDPAEWRYPAVPPDWVDRIRREMPPYDPRLSPTRSMGAVAELFRNWPGALRSAHPQSSFAALGPRAETILVPHSLDFRFGPDTPLAHLEALGATAVMLGAPWSTISAFYRTQADAGATAAHRRRSPVSTPDGSRWVDWQDHTYSQHWFGDAVDMLLSKGLARRGRIGKADTLVLPLADALPAVRDWRRAAAIA